MASESKTVIVAALIGNSIIAVTKFVAAAITGSSAMFAEGVHSVVDTGNQWLMLLGLARAKRPPSLEFPFGHGKEVYFWSFVVAMSIFGVGSGISLYEGIIHLLHPTELGNPTINYAVLGVAIVAEASAWYIAWKGFHAAKGKSGVFEAVREGKDPSLFVVLFEDSAALLGLLVAVVGIALSQITGSSLYDALASVVIGLILGTVALWLAFETKSLLIGEAAHPSVRRGIRELAAETEGVERINELVTLHMGPDHVIVNMSLDFRDDLSADRLEGMISSLNEAIKHRFTEVQRVFIEAESWKRHLAQAPYSGGPAATQAPEL